MVLARDKAGIWIGNLVHVVNCYQSWTTNSLKCQCNVLNISNATSVLKNYHLVFQANSWSLVMNQGQSDETKLVVSQLFPAPSPHQKHLPQKVTACSLHPTDWTAWKAGERQRETNNTRVCNLPNWDWVGEDERAKGSQKFMFMCILKTASPLPDAWS